ncbi:uncharacterized protein C5orf52 homolog [Tachyglossus aculeatus]|uniref:uncharacterized protein C5orf52 homolog n=1 Tax=Tachyglossus aculeatus TaxID=9261 RepID=UPI0018F33FD4|nr:uncharacterized protein C5orf52 homolog [Tachyglossus aculeatus]
MESRRPSPSVGVGQMGVSPRVSFLHPRGTPVPVLFSLTNSSDAAMKHALPKSHLPQVIIHDNISAQRICEIESNATDKTKRKSAHQHNHLKKKFLTDQIKKIRRWRREAQSFLKYMALTNLESDEEALAGTSQADAAQEPPKMKIPSRSTGEAPSKSNSPAAASSAKRNASMSGTGASL